MEKSDHFEQEHTLFCLSEWLKIDQSSFLSDVTQLTKKFKVSKLRKVYFQYWSTG